MILDVDFEGLRREQAGLSMAREERVRRKAKFSSSIREYRMRNEGRQPEDAKPPAEAAGMTVVFDDERTFR